MTFHFFFCEQILEHMKVKSDYIFNVLQGVNYEDAKNSKIVVIKLISICSA